MTSKTQIETRPMRAVLVDDEELARRYLRELLAPHPEIEIVGECANGFEAVKAVRDLAPDLLFLDIQMPKLDGFEVLELIDDRPTVIFVTAYDEYALKAFEVHAQDYLLKPFAADRLDACLARLGDLPHRPLSERQRPPAHELTAAARPPAARSERIVVKDGAQVTVLPVDQLDYAEAEGDYVCLHSGDRSWLKHQTLASLAQTLDDTRFVRIHRSTLVNLDRVVRIEPYSKDSRLAVLASGTELPISKSGYKRIKSLLDEST
jgi:two-component system, LytTR family, response regulator